MEYENREHQATQHIIEDMAAQVQREKKKIAGMMQPLCDSLNALIPIKSDEDKDKMNALIAEVQAKVPNFNLYWDRDLYLDCNANSEELRKRTLHSGMVHFEPSDDPEEHPGITVRYISHMHRFDGFGNLIQERNMKQQIIIGRHVSDIMKLPCIFSCHKGENDEYVYLLYPTMEVMDYTELHEGDTLIIEEDGSWSVKRKEQQ